MPHKTSTENAPVALHIGTITEAAERLSATPRPDNLNKLLTAYDSALRTLKTQYGPGAAAELITAVEDDVLTALQEALSEEPGAATEDILTSFTTHVFNDAADATTLLTKALTSALLESVFVECVPVIRDYQVRYLLNRSGSPNSDCATAARHVGWLVSNTDLPFVQMLLDPVNASETLPDTATTAILRHALHADQQVVVNSLYPGMKSDAFQDAVAAFRDDVKNGEIPTDPGLTPEEFKVVPDQPIDDLSPTTNLENSPFTPLN